jgi:osmotically-inducible protein OsmY
MNTDSEIQENVVDALNWDASIDSSGLTVTVKDGLATLVGQVRGYSEKLDARRTAQCVPGVRAVNVRIDVVPMDASSDAEIASAVVQALSLGSCLPGGQVKVRVEDGWVSLSGAVDWNYQRHNAAAAMCYLAGVKGLINNMTLTTARV